MGPRLFLHHPTGSLQTHEDGTPLVTKIFPREPESVPVACRFVHGALEEWNLSGLAGAAELVTSELATNAVLHARHGTFRVTLRRRGGGQVRVSVTDKSRTLPEPADPADDEDHGRGLAIVEAVSQQWGAEPLKRGKRVWADLAVPAGPDPPERRVPGPTGPYARVTYVLMVLAVATLLIAATVGPR